MNQPVRFANALILFATGAVFVCALWFVLNLITVQAATAGTITVTNSNDDGEGSLREAVRDAQDGDTIVFDPKLSGTTISLTSGEIHLSRSVTIDGRDAPTLTISGGGNSRVFYVDGLQAEIRNVTLTGGTGSGTTFPAADGNGGCVYATKGALVESTSVTLENVEMYGCQAPFRGGAIASTYVEVKCSQCYLHDNMVTSALGFGGGFYAFAGANLTSTFVLTGSQVLSNTAAIGGGCVNEGNGAQAQMYLENSFIAYNRADLSGGGCANAALTGVSDAQMEVNRSFLVGNEAGVSCGALCNDGEASVSNTMIASNQAITGGAFSNAGSLSMNFCTVANNEAKFGTAGSYSDAFGRDAELNINNCLFDNPEPPADDLCFELRDEGVGETDISGGGNNWQDGACVALPNDTNLESGLVCVDTGVCYLGKQTEVNGTSTEDRPGGVDVFGVPSGEKETPGAQRSLRLLTVRKEVEPPGDANFPFSVERSELGPVQRDRVLLGDGEAETFEFGDEIRVTEDLVRFGLRPYSIEVVCTPPEAIIKSLNTGNLNQATVTVRGADLSQDEITCTFRNTRWGSITTFKVISDTDGAPDISFPLSLATDTEQITSFLLNAENTKTVEDLDPGEYYLSESPVPEGWELDYVVCDAQEYRRTNDPSTPGVAINLQPGEDVTCEFVNKKVGALGSEPEPSPEPDGDGQSRVSLPIVLSGQ